MQYKAKYKRDRTLLQNTWGLDKSPFNKKKYKPGILKKTTSSTSLYGVGMRNKQYLRAFYANIKDYQLKNIFRKSIRTGNNFEASVIQSLELRLDTILFRTGFAKTPMQARQLISHRNVIVDNRIVDRASFLVKDRSIIRIAEKAHFIVDECMSKISRVIPPYCKISNLERKEITIHQESLPKKAKELSLANEVDFNIILRLYRL